MTLILIHEMDLQIILLLLHAVEQSNCSAQRHVGPGNEIARVPVGVSREFQIDTFD